MTFTLYDLRDLMPAGDAAKLTESNARSEFYELGYDSLALLEFSSRLLRQCGDRIPEDELVLLRTPQGAVDYVNALRAREAKS